MHINQCSKCGKDFETKNPKRIVCPNCLYLDRAAAPSIPVRRPGSTSPAPQEGSGGDYGSAEGGYQQPYGEYQNQGGYGPPRGQGGYGPPRGQGGPPRNQGGYGPPRGQGGYGPPRGQGGPPRNQGGYGPPRGQGSYGPPRGQGGPPRNQGGYGPPRGQGGYGPPRGGRGGPPRGGQRVPQKNLLIPKEILAEIENRYKVMLPLPNPDAHVKIAEELNLDPKKVFFGINLIRQKMKLPKQEFPKRPLAVTEDQLVAIKTLYEPFLPVPPIGIHKIIAKQLKIDEWRVHVAIGLVRKQMAVPRWNEEREDLPAKMKEELEAVKSSEEKEQEKEAAIEKKKPEKKASAAKKTPGRKKKVEDTEAEKIASED